MIYKTYLVSFVSVAGVAALTTSACSSEPATCNCTSEPPQVTVVSGGSTAQPGTNNPPTSTGGTGNNPPTANAGTTAAGTNPQGQAGTGMAGNTAAGAAAAAGDATAGGGAAAGGAATGGTGGAATADTCPGCAQMSLPFTEAGQSTNFQIYLAGPTDLSDAVLTVRLYAPGAQAGGLQIIPQTGEASGYQGYYNHWQNLADAANDWIDVSLDFADTVPAATANLQMGAAGAAGAGDAAGGMGGTAGTGGTGGTGGISGDAGAPDEGSAGAPAEEPMFDPSQVEILGFQIAAGDTGPWTNPTIVLIDSITISTGVEGPWEFTDSTDPLTPYEAEALEGTTLTHIPAP